MTISPVESPAPLSLVRRLLPSLAAFILLPLVALGLLLWRQHQQHLDELIAADAEAVATDLSRVLDLQTSGLATAALPLTEDPAVAAAIVTDDADALLAAWSGRFAAMLRVGRLSRLYFHRANRTCLLRLHDPTQRDDLIERPSLIQAARTGRTASGLEIGPLGTLSLRVVEPVRKDGVIVGFVELGHDAEDALRILQKHLAAWNQMAILVFKDRLDRKSWETAQAALGREAVWDRLPRHVVHFATQGRLPDPFTSQGELPLRGTGEVAWDGRHWRFLLHPLADEFGEIGHILALRDVSDERSALLVRLLAGSAGGLLVLGLVFVFVHRLLRHADGTIAAQQARLHDERWRLGCIIEATRAGTWEWDLLSDDAQVSERWAQMLGLTSIALDRYPRSEWEARIHPDDLEPAREMMRRHIAGAEPFIDIEYRLRHADGGWRWIHCRGQLFAQATPGAPQVVFGTHSDISERKQSEAERLRLEEQKLARELGEMMHANRLVALGTLMAGLAHEFNHPAQVLRLNQQSLRSFVEAAALASRDLPGPAVGLLTWPEVAAAAPQMLDDMEMATAQLSELIASVQDYARPNERQCRAIDPRMLLAVARSSLCLVRAYARRRQVALIDALGPGEDGRPEGCGCLQQVVVNLLINAVQACQPGGRVTLATGCGDGRFWLDVADDGPGIDPAVLARLGQPFVTTRGAQGGSGLGLFICLRLVREQGGSLELTQLAPHGTLARVSYDEPRRP